ncbi:MAG: glutamate racemase [Patescibacteria group bacterium]|nr:glutamate racemase [Patescibacteria group bacterium]MDD4304198.1 glutamate racemase [Patescibacteria group bacterium]MDD4695230.1 glutamate racemase [Patescibacteria group bacterium]
MIGIFDSGLGGLITFKEIKKILPKYSYIYLGDTLRSPYGGRSQEAVYEYTKNAVDFLFDKGCKLIIVACNTASSDALRKIQQEHLPKINDESKNVLGVVRPLVEEAIDVSKTKRIGVVGTRATVNSNVYGIELKKLDKNIKVFQCACPLLVPLIEENWIKRRETKMILKKYIKELKDYNIDTLILGCTHYPILLDEFKNVMGKKINVLNSSKIIAEKLEIYLKNHKEIEKGLDKYGNIEYLVTDITENYEKMSQMILGKKVKFEKVKI